MSNPKRRHSNQRTRKRRTHQKIRVNSMSVCPTCGAPKRAHRVCPKCGSYKNQPYLNISTGNDKKTTP